MGRGLCFGPQRWLLVHERFDISSGRTEIKWNIFWGPHWDDTEEFRYWITKANLVFNPNEARTWDDFEAEPFCVLFYGGQYPTANTDVVKTQEQNWFSTFCNVPARDGHRVLYGEFPSCVCVASFRPLS